MQELAKSADSPKEHGQAALTLAEVMDLTGDRAAAEEAAVRADDGYRHEGATAYVAWARRLAAERAARNRPPSGPAWLSPGTARSGTAR